ncbi:MAG: hypothetical protein ACKOQS_01840, partial [Dolichospermum sp.]
VQSMSSVLSTQRIFVTVIICLMITSCSGGTSSNTSGSGGTSSNTSGSGGTSSNTSGRCNSPDDKAADGSRCGGRAASVRPGGR